MGFLDRLLGRGKQAAGDMTGDAEMRREGMAQEREGGMEGRTDMPERAPMAEPEERPEARDEGDQGAA